MLSKEKLYGIEVDWWSYGVTLYTFLYGKSPFRTDAAKALKPDKTYLQKYEEYWKVYDAPTMAKAQKLGPYWRYICFFPHARQLLRRMLLGRPRAR